MNIALRGFDCVEPGGIILLRVAQQPLLPRFIEVEARRIDRRMVRLERTELDALVKRNSREVAAALARIETTGTLHLDTFVGDLGRLLAQGGVDLWDQLYLTAAVRADQSSTFGFACALARTVKVPGPAGAV